MNPLGLGKLAGAFGMEVRGVHIYLEVVQMLQQLIATLRDEFLLAQEGGEAKFIPSDLTLAMIAWKSLDLLAYEMWMVGEASPPPEVQRELDAMKPRDVQQRVRWTRKAHIDGWLDEEWGDFHGSETQGPDPMQARQSDADDRHLAWLHRDEDDASILRRWNVDEGQWTDEVMEELQAIQDADDRAVWTERMTAFREAQLRRLLRQYFGRDDYMKREIVLRWKQEDGRWVPEEKLIVREWVARTIEEKGSRMAGFASCCGTLRQKIARKRAAGKFVPEMADVPAPRKAEPVVTRKSYAEARAGRERLLSVL